MQPSSDPSPAPHTPSRTPWQIFACLVVVAAGCAIMALAAEPVAPVAAQEADPAALWDAGIDFQQFLGAADRRRRQWHANYDRAAPSPAALERAGGLTGSYRILAVAEDWCGDSVHTIPYLARLVELSASLDMRIVDAEAGAGILARHRTPDDRGATPTLLILDGDGAAAGAWVERPSELQDWFLTNPEDLGRRALFDRKYAWYEEDRGRSTLDEVLALLEGADAGWRLADQDSGTDALLQAVDPVSEQVVWVSGHEGTWGLTLDGGDTWRTRVMEGGEELQFRDVEARDAHTAWLLSAGSGTASRIYRTDDGGDTWRLQFRNEDPDAFFDCLDFWDAEHGVAFSDAVDGEFVILRTEDGETWQRVDPDAVPDALPGEGSFAASGTCLVTGPGGRAWIGTGNALEARVLYTEDHGRSWSVTATPLVAGPSAGIASVAFRDGLHGVALGGDIGAPDQFHDAVAATGDGGRSWSLVGRTPFPGAVYGSAWVPGTDPPALVVAGPGGLAVSTDDGRAWVPLDRRSHWAVAFVDGAGWAAGPRGRITRLTRTTSPETDP